jgi:hypothetical protein
VGGAAGRGARARMAGQAPGESHRRGAVIDELSPEGSRAVLRAARAGAVARSSRLALWMHVHPRETASRTRSR